MHQNHPDIARGEDPITSRSNSLVKQARALRQGKWRASTGLFLVEGIHHVGEVIEAGWEIEAILYAPETLASQFALELISRFAGRLARVSEPVLESIADKDNPQGILAIVRQQHRRLDDLVSIRFGVALVSPQDPGNLGAVLRTLDAVGGDALFVLDGGVDAYHPTAIRASMGAAFWKPIIQAPFSEFDGWRRKHRVQLIGTSAGAERRANEISVTVPWILLVGSEQKGLSDDHTRACDIAVSLPMRGRVSSLNLAVATGILLYTLT